jgi:hypothetical protein
MMCGDEDRRMKRREERDLYKEDDEDIHRRV